MKEVVERFTRAGVLLAAREDKLILRPREKVTPELIALARQHKPALLRIILEKNGVLAQPPPVQGLTPGQCILEVCRQYGVAIRLDENGDVVVGKADAQSDEPTQPWPGLLAMLEAHLGEVADLLAAGWELRAEFRDRDRAAA